MKPFSKILFSLIFISCVYAQDYKYTNTLINEESPYLLQHAHNPVNWYPWGKEALEKAKKENKLIFLSIGYSTCHWCHVMEEESFSNEDVAKILNKDYISIKVDREEKPHIDKHFQEIYKLLNNKSGGWPLNIILTPDAKPFYAATYLPKSSQYTRTIEQTLTSISELYIKNKEKVIQNSKLIDQIYKQNSSNDNNLAKKNIDMDIMDEYVNSISKSFDNQFYGFGKTQKFPHASLLETLLEIYAITKNEKALEIVTKSLYAMAKGGIYDQVEGGFFRYSTDKEWIIPHFEKMLYTNAELLSIYSKAYLITKDDYFKTIAIQLVNFLEDKFESNNLYFSAIDADSIIDDMKHEGYYYLYDYTNLTKALKISNFDNDEIKNILDYYHITKDGNFDNNLNHLYIDKTIKIDNIANVKKVLKTIRKEKSEPFKDKKILTSWNAMTISSLFDTSFIDKRYGKKAITNLDTLLNTIYIKEILYHQKTTGNAPKENAYLEDYSYLITALIKAYDYSLDEKYLLLAKKLTNEALKKFLDGYTWYLNDDSFKVKAKFFDSEYKNTISNMIENLYKIAILTDDTKLHQFTNNILKNTPLDFQLDNASMVKNTIPYTKSYLVIKSKRENLLNITYPYSPFIIKKITKDNDYLVCTINTCISYNKDFTKVKETIVEYINNKDF